MVAAVIVYHHQKKLRMKKSQGSCSHQSTELSCGLEPSFTSLPELPDVPHPPAQISSPSKGLSFLSHTYDMDVKDTDVKFGQSGDMQLSGSSHWYDER